jgi:predicted lactoylglutathione lyase
MKAEIPGAIPEIPVSDIATALEYYDSRLGFNIDWGDQGGDGIAGISNGNCRLFLTNAAFREHYGNSGPVLIWLNLDSKEAVDALYRLWHGNQAKILSPPESKPWGLYEFTAADPDGNLLRVFYDFATPEHETRA